VKNENHCFGIVAGLKPQKNASKVMWEKFGPKGIDLGGVGA